MRIDFCGWTGVGGRSMNLQMALLIIFCMLVVVIAVFSLFRLNQNAIMQAVAQVGPMVSFASCLLGGVILLLNGLDREDFVWSSFGLIFIGIAFFVGPMLWLAARK